MNGSVMDAIASAIAKLHRQLLDVTAESTDEQAAWSPGAHAPSMAFHLWHVARGADRHQALLPTLAEGLARRLGPREELWRAQGLAERWGLNASALGVAESGSELDDEAATSLALPRKDVVLAYARDAFAADRAFVAVDDELFLASCPAFAGGVTTIGTLIIEYLAHAGRHLGMIECLRGVQGMRGTASR